MRTIQDIGRDIATQDNEATDLPIFCVEQERSRVVSADHDFDVTDPVWVDMDNRGDEVDADLQATLERKFQAGDPTPAQYVRGQRITWWEFVTPCFTRAGAEAYLRVDGHNLTNPRIYVRSAYRNEEWGTVRDHLAAMGDAT